MNLNIDPIQPIFFIPEKLNQPLFIKNWSLKPHLDPKRKVNYVVCEQFEANLT